MSERITVSKVDLGRRAAPQQKRSQDRIRQIVDATKRLLENDSDDAITTSSVAVEAGVPVSSVYRYFPNIYSVFAAILDDYQSETDRIIAARLADPEDMAWRDSLRGMILGLRDVVANDPSYARVFRITLTTPELQARRDEWKGRLVQVLEARWVDGADGFTGGNPHHVARMAVEIYCAAELLVFDLGQTSAAAEAYFEEALIALERYLSSYLD